LEGNEAGFLGEITSCERIMRVTVSVGIQHAGEKMKEGVFQKRIESFERKMTYFFLGRDIEWVKRMTKKDRKCGISN